MPAILSMHESGWKCSAICRDCVALVIDDLAVINLNGECRRGFAAIVQKPHIAGHELRGREGRDVVPIVAVEQLERTVTDVRY